METPQSSRHNNGNDGGSRSRRRSSIGVDEAPYHAPLAPFEQIAADLHLVGFTDITVADLQETRKDKIRNLYAFLLEICAGITELELDQRATLYRLKCQDVYQYDFADTLHCNFVDFLFFLELRSIVEAAGYDKFSLRDLHTPTPRRLQIILSNLINFCKYREQQIPVYTSLMESRYKVTGHYENLLEEKAGLWEQRDLVQAEAEDRLAETANLAQRCVELEQLYMEMNAQQSNDRKMGNEAKKAAERIKDQIETARWEVENIMDKMTGLEATTRVHSPERKIQECHDRKKALDTIKLDHVTLCEEIEAVAAVTHQAQTYQQPLAELQDLASQYGHVQDKVRLAKAEEAKIQAQIRDIDQQQLEVDQTIEQEERTLARLQYQMDHAVQHRQDQDISEDEYRRQRTNALEQEERAKQRYQELQRAYQLQIATQAAELHDLDTVLDEMVDEYCETLTTGQTALLQE
jgi:Nuf2 family